MSLLESFHQFTQKARQWLKEDVAGESRVASNNETVTAMTPFIEPNLMQDNLPYQYVDDAGFFINKGSVGFGFLMEPASGADETLMLQLANLIKNKLPPEVEVQCMLVAHPWIAERLREGLVGLRSDNPMLKELAAQSLRFHQHAALQGYKNPRRIPAVLRDYQVFLFVSQKMHKKPEPVIASLTLVREEMEAELYSAKLGFSRLSLPTFLALIRRLLTPNVYTTEWPTVTHDPDLTLNHQCIEKGSSWTVEKNFVDVTYPHQNETGEVNHHTTRILNLGLNHVPKQFRLWMTPDNYSNLFSSSKGLTCPFVMNLIFKVKSKAQSQNKANAAFMVAEQTAGGSKDKFETGAAEKRAERRAMKDLLNDDLTAECDLFFNLTLFSTPKHAKRDETNAMSSFAVNGIELYPVQLLQQPAWLATLPFLSSEGLWIELDRFGLVRHKLKHFNVTNLLPMVADFKGSRCGVLLPTFRHQLSFINIFDDVRLPITSFNMTIAAQTGSGKSVFCQSLIEMLLSQQAQVFVIDMGKSYKHFCEAVGGDYIDASTITLNPFTLFDLEGEGNHEKNAKIIRNLLAVMAKPVNQELPGVAMDWLLKTSLYVLKTKGNKANMDDVFDYLKVLYLEEKQHEPRLSDLILSMEKYTTQGAYGDIFNGDTPLLNKKPFVVLEMSAFEEDDDLARIIMHVMVLIINGQFYHSPRNQMKFCLMEEAWRTLIDEFNQSKQEAKFLQAGFRTSRKYRASFGVVVQDHSVLDSTTQGRAIQSCSDIKIILRQGDDFDVYTKNYPDKFTVAEQVIIKNFGEAKNNGYSEMMLKIGKVSSFHRLFLNPFTKVLFSSDGAEVEAVQDERKKGLSVIEAVKKVSRERYGDMA